eukprot:CCRYP_006717-RA/>CCRYP_006717-RA protein AED:0.04 eAED:0.03 QI:0/1/0.66/1/1/1/3/929/403
MNPLHENSPTANSEHEASMSQHAMHHDEVNYTINNDRCTAVVLLLYLFTRDDQKDRSMTKSNRPIQLVRLFHGINVIALITTIGFTGWIQNNSFLHRSPSTFPRSHRENTRKVSRIEANRSASSSVPLPCNLLDHPVPMILMSLGRSGTSSMYQVISSLSGKETTRIFEYTGGSTEKSRIFFQKIVPKEDVNGEWLIKFLCLEQMEHPDAGVVAFKWKPYETLFEEDKALQGLELLGRLNRKIKVVRSKRNLLDVMISRRKHKISLKRHGIEGKISSHCQKGDNQCLNAQLKAGIGIELPTKSLLTELRHLHDMERRTDNLLARYNVPTIHVSFEKLFSADEDTTEWRRMFDYLGVGPDNFSYWDIEHAGHAATSVPLHNVTLSNYEDVRKILIGTEFEVLLH